MRALQLTAHVEARPTEDGGFYQAAILKLNGRQVWESGVGTWVRDEDDAERACAVALIETLKSAVL